MVPTHILKAKTAKFQVLTPFGSLFFRYPIFKVYTIVYNSAGRFSTLLKTFSSLRVFRPFIEQGASPPVLWSRGASPPPPGGVFFPGRACQRCNIYVYIYDNTTFHRTGGLAPCSMKSGGFAPLLLGVSFPRSRLPAL